MTAQMKRREFITLLRKILIIRRTGTGLANSWQVVATALIPPD